MGAALNKHCVAFFRLGVMQAARLIGSADPELGQSATALDDGPMQETLLVTESYEGGAPLAHTTALSGQVL